MNSPFNLLPQSSETGCGSKQERTFGQSYNSTPVDTHDKHCYDIWTDPSKPRKKIDFLPLPNPCVIQPHGENALLWSVEDTV